MEKNFENHPYATWNIFEKNKRKIYCFTEDPHKEKICMKAAWMEVSNLNIYH